MGVVNRLLQASCSSWSNNTLGFRPGFGTKDCITTLALNFHDIRSQRVSNPVILSFDLTKAYNSVNIDHMAVTLKLKGLPKNLRTLLWNWHHPVNCSVNPLNGLTQGFNYSPTLFAWYLDTAVVKNTHFIVYADNFAGIFESKNDAKTALANVQTLLIKTGLSIQPETVKYFSLDNAKVFPWLGHHLELTTGGVLLNKCQRTKDKKPPVYISTKEWEVMLQKTNWLQNVKASGWRDF
jgi:hypothetical protein